MKIILLVFYLSLIHISTFAQELNYDYSLDFTINGSNLLDNKYSLTRISDVVMNSKEELFVLDMDEQTIYFFDPKGQFNKKIGRVGKGPCEFLGAHKFELIEQSKLVVVDNGNRRFTILDPYGIEDCKIFSYPKEIKIVKDFKVDNKNEIFIESIDVKFIDKKMQKRTILSKYDENFKFISVIDSSDYYIERKKLGPNKVKVRVPYPNKMIWDILPNNNVIVGNVHKDVVRIYTGSSCEKISLSVEKIFINQKHKEYYFKTNSFLQEDGTWKQEAPIYVRNSLEFPKYRPLINDFIVDPTNKKILINISTDRGNPNYLICNLDGKVLKRIKLSTNIFNEYTSIFDNFLTTHNVSNDGFPILLKYSSN